MTSCGEAHQICWITLSLLVSLRLLQLLVSIKFYVFVDIVNGRLIFMRSHATCSTAAVCPCSRHHQRVRSMNGSPPTIICCERSCWINMHRWRQFVQNIDKLLRGMI